MNIGDIIRLNSGAIGAFDLKSDIGMVVGTIPRKDNMPDDFEIMVDGDVHRMGSQLRCSAEVLNASR